MIENTPHQGSQNEPARRAGVNEGEQYVNGNPTYTTGTAVPGERPWNGSLDPIAVEPLTEKAGKTISHLVEVNIDSAKGWDTAADAVTDQTLKARFREFAGQRRRFADELVGVLGARGEASPDHGVATGALHRWWVNLRASLGVMEVKTVLSHAESSEDQMCKAYSDALKDGELAGLRRMVEDQAIQVKRVHDETKMLRDTWKAH